MAWLSTLMFSFLLFASSFGQAPVMRFSFDGNFVEQKMNVSGVLSGACGLVTDRFGRPMSAFGTGPALGFLTFPDTTLLPAGTAPRTITVWAKASTTTWRAFFFSYGPLATNADFRLGMDSNSGLYFCGGNCDLTGGTGVSNNQWRFLAVTFSSGSLKVFVDGVQVISGTLACLNTVRSQLFLGKAWDAEYYIGSLDDFRVYDSVLTTTQLDFLRTVAVISVSPATVSPAGGQAIQLNMTSVTSFTNASTVCRISKPSGQQVTTFAGSVSTSTKVILCPLPALSVGQYVVEVSPDGTQWTDQNNKFWVQNTITLAARFDFDSNFVEKVSNGAAKAYGPNITFASDRFGRPMSALALGPSPSFLNFSDSMLPQGQTPRTISVWFKSRNDSQTYMGIWDYGQHIFGNRFGVVLTASGEIWMIGEFCDVRPAVTNFGDLKWHHLVVVFDGTKLLVQIDGSIIAETFHPCVNTVPSTLSIGKGWSWEPFTGLIDDFRVYFGALSQADIEFVRDVVVFGASAAARVGQTLEVTVSNTSKFDNFTTLCRFSTQSGQLISVTPGTTINGTNTKKVLCPAPQFQFGRHKVDVSNDNGTHWTDYDSTFELSDCPSTWSSADSAHFRFFDLRFSILHVHGSFCKNFEYKCQLQSDDSSLNITSRSAFLRGLAELQCNGWQGAVPSSAKVGAKLTVFEKIPQGASWIPVPSASSETKVNILFKKEFKISVV